MLFIHKEIAGSEYGFSQPEHSFQDQKNNQQPTFSKEERKKYIAKKRILGFNFPLTSITSEFHPKKLKRISLTSLFNCNHIHSVFPYLDENFSAKDKNLITESGYVNLIKGAYPDSVASFCLLLGYFSSGKGKIEWI